MSAKPRTDAAYDASRKEHSDYLEPGDPPFIGYQLLDECVKLETELTSCHEIMKQMAKILIHVWGGGCGREFFPENLDGTQNETFQDVEFTLTAFNTHMKGLEK